LFTRSVWLLLVGAGCGFDVAGNVPTDARDAAPDSIDAEPDALRVERTLALVAHRDAGDFLVTLPFDNVTGFHAPCAEAPAAPSKDLEPHPTLPYVYSVSSGFEGFALNCTAPKETSLGTLGATRPLQRVVVSPTGDVGFFTIDGAGALGVGRFVADSTGTPTLTAMENGPTQSGGLVLDATHKQLFLTGQSTLWSYALANDLSITGATMGVLGCATPAAVDIEGDTVFEFCADSPIVRTFSRSPLAAGADAGSVGAADIERPLPGGAALIARSTPPSLALVNLTIPVNVLDSIVLADRLTALAASADGTFAVTAVTSGTQTVLDLYSVEAASLHHLATSTIVGTVTGAAITGPLTP
jgi:hypothetical protein